MKVKIPLLRNPSPLHSTRALPNSSWHMRCNAMRVSLPGQVDLATSVRHKLKSPDQSICSCLPGSSNLKKSASNARLRDKTSAHSLRLPATCEMRSCSLWRAAYRARDCRTLARGCFREMPLCEAATTPALSQLWRREIQPACHTSPIDAGAGHPARPIAPGLPGLRCVAEARRHSDRTMVAMHPAPAGS